MLIRSQNGNDLVVTDNLSDINVHMGDVVAYSYGMHYQLGHYRDDEVARKVVDMMEEAYKKDGQLIAGNCSTNFIPSDLAAINKRAVFHMPQDEEVKI